MVDIHLDKDRYCSLNIYPDLQGKVVFITGGATGIGEGLVRGFVQQGAHVVAVDINRLQGEKLQNELNNLDEGSFRFVVCDIRDTNCLQRAIEETEFIEGPISILINNAADDTRHEPDQVDEKFWDDNFSINLRPVFFTTKAVIPQMKLLGGGSIINFGSVSWHIKQVDMPCYTAAKAAVEGLTKTLAGRFGEFGIRVNNLIPGWVMTEKQMTARLTPQAINDVLSRQCIKEGIVINDIVNAALFLASDCSRMMTSQSITIDGGLS